MPFLGLGLSLIIAIYFSLHAYRTGREYYWIGLMIGAPFLGSLIYFLAVYLPDMRQSRLGYQLQSKLQRALDPGKALREAQKAVAIAPTVENRLRLAKALVDNDQATQALDYYAEIVAQPLYENDNDILLFYADALFHAGQFAQSKQQLERLFQLNTLRDVEAQLLYAKNLALLQQNTEAKQAFEHLLANNPNLETQIYYANLLVHWGEIEQAKQLLNQVEQHIEQLPKHAKLLNSHWIKQAKTLRNQLK